MDYFLLPEKIKSQLPPPGERPPFAMSASGGLDGTVGECYLLVFESSVSLFHKKPGSDFFVRLDAATSDPAFSFEIKKERFNVTLEISSSAWRHSLKFSNFDAGKLEELSAGLKRGSVTSLAAPVPAAAEPSVELDPFAALLAATMFVAGFDGSIEAAEDAFIKNLAGSDLEAFSQALKIYKSCSSQELAAALSGLDREGRLCVAANMFETAIADGVLRSGEQRMIIEFAGAMGLSGEDCYAIRDVLVAKAKAPLLKSPRKAC